MNNRLVVGLAVGAGYVLGRTKKAKLAFAVGTMVAGRRLRLSPGVLGEFVARQLQSNPQFKEVGDQLREDLRGVGKAATGALVNRRIERIADIAEGRSPGLAQLALGGARKAPQGKGPLRSAVELGASHLKENVTQAFKGLGGKRKKDGEDGADSRRCREYVGSGNRGRR
jgi:hypothetical protein